MPHAHDANVRTLLEAHIFLQLQADTAQHRPLLLPFMILTTSRTPSAYILITENPSPLKVCYKKVLFEG